MIKKKPHIHFVGIGGIGMSGIAEVFCLRGFSVSGSDSQESDTTKRLSQIGISIHVGHKSEYVDGASVVVVSSAVRPQNPEILEAKKRNIPVIPRAEALGELMRGKTGIAVAGTHGKTTTTSLLSTVFTYAGLDPTCVIGGKVDALGGNAKSGSGEYMIAEADESDGSFLQLPATYSIITNIDNDHLDHYGSLEKIDSAFVQFVGHLPFYGLALVCGDDIGVQRVLSEFKKPFMTYGFLETNDYQITNYSAEEFGTNLNIEHKQKKLAKVSLPTLGKHNALNALAVFALSHQMGLAIDVIVKGLESFSGVKRRFETRYKDNERNIKIIDDYGHHPTEVRATLSAAKQLKSQKRIITVFQPHRFSRTQSCIEEFSSSFSDTDTLIVADIYPAGEQPIAGIDGDFFIKKIQASKHKPKNIFGPFDLEKCAKKVQSLIQDDDVIICLGAGTITKLPQMLIDSFSNAKT